MYNNRSFFSNTKNKKAGVGLLNMQRIYKNFGAAVLYGKLSKKESYIIERINKQFNKFKERRENIENIKNLKTLKGIRHIKNYPVNGQRTRTNGKTRKLFRRI